MDIADIQRQIGELTTLAEALQKEPTSLNARIFQKYIEFESTPKVAEYLRNNGFRTKKNTSFRPGDISDIIENEHEGIDPSMVRTAQAIFRRNRKSVERQYG